MEKIKPNLSVEFYRESNENEPVRVWLPNGIIRILFMVKNKTMVLLHVPSGNC